MRRGGGVAAGGAGAGAGQDVAGRHGGSHGAHRIVVDGVFLRMRELGFVEVHLALEYIDTNGRIDRTGEAMCGGRS